MLHIFFVAPREIFTPQSDPSVHSLSLEEWRRADDSRSQIGLLPQQLASEDVELTLEQRVEIWRVAQAVDRGELAQVIGIASGSSIRDVKRAYFSLSRQFHPDKFYGKRLGSYRTLLEGIFAALSQYVKTLSDDRTAVLDSGKTDQRKRRRHERFATRTQVKLLAHGWQAPIDCVATDISLGGLFLATPGLVERDETVSVRFPEIESRSFMGRVAYARTTPPTGNVHQLAGLAIEFHPHTNDEIAALRDIVMWARGNFDKAVQAEPTPTPRKPDYPDYYEDVIVENAAPSVPETRARLARGTTHGFRPIIGIDLGTTHTSVSVAKDRQVHILPFPGDIFAIPSVVAFAANGARIVGPPAKALIATDPKHVLTSPKRLLGRRPSDPDIAHYVSQAAYETAVGPDGNLLVQMRGELIAIPQACANLFEAAKQAAETALETTVEKAVLTVPVSFGADRVELLRRAARFAGLETVAVLDEPTAAALAHRHTPGFGGMVGIYDFGGGTFDFSIVDCTTSDFRVLAATGDSWLGGEDFDLTLAEAIANEFWRHHGVDLRKRIVEWQRLVSESEQAKRFLSLQDHANVVVPDALHTAQGSRDLRVKISRKSCDPLFAPLIERSIATATQAATLAGVSLNRLTGIYLSGGTSYIPAVAATLTQRFNVPVKTAAPPEHAVCLGAGVCAAHMARRTTVQRVTVK